MKKSYKSIPDSYKAYKKDSDNPVDLKTYLRLNGLYNKFLINKALEGEQVVLPCKLGSLSVAGRKQKIRFNEEGRVIGLAPDWVKTKKLWDEKPEAKEKRTLLYHTNAHSDGVRYKYVWSKRNVLIRNKTLYSLKLTRANKRALHAKIMSGTEYVTKY